jgi:hypothetical protein
MTKGLIFWLLMLLWLLFGLYWTWPEVRMGSYGLVGSNTVLFVLLTLLGWKTYGPPVQG